MFLLVCKCLAPITNHKHSMLCSHSFQHQGGGSEPGTVLLARVLRAWCHESCIPCYEVHEKGGSQGCFVAEGQGQGTQGEGFSQDCFAKEVYCVGSIQEAGCSCWWRLVSRRPHVASNVQLVMSLFVNGAFYKPDLPVSMCPASMTNVIEATTMPISGTGNSITDSTAIAHLFPGHNLVEL